ncbi:hypothetical protein N9V90_02555 [Endozoicomonas sp.]|nr:hypothetical protein [Endozoicomonas sp.]
MNIANRLPVQLFNAASIPSANMASSDARKVVTSVVRKVSSKADNNVGNDAEKRSVIFRKIKQLGGGQKIVQSVSGPYKNKVLLCSGSLAGMGICRGAAHIYSPSFYLFDTLTDFPWLSLALGTFVSYRYLKGAYDAVKLIPESSSLMDLKKEEALKEACLKAEFRQVLDYWEGRDVKSYETDIGKIERKCFDDLKLDFRKPLSKQMVESALGQHPDKHYAKIRLLGEHKKNGN